MEQKMPLNQKTILRLRKALRQEPEVLATYLFGSQALGYAGKRSDLDIGLIVDNIDKVDYRKLYGKVASQIEGKEVDVRLIDINDLDPLFAFNVIKSGLCLYKRQEDKRIEIEKRIMHHFFDNQHMREIYHFYLNESIRKGTFGHVIKFNN